MHCQQKMCPQGVAVMPRTPSRQRGHFSLAEPLSLLLTTGPHLSGSPKEDCFRICNETIMPRKILLSATPQLGSLPLPPIQCWFLNVPQARLGSNNQHWMGGHCEKLFQHFDHDFILRNWLCVADSSFLSFQIQLTLYDFTSSVIVSCRTDTYPKRW